MCLVALAWRAHARWPLVVAGNRDERHARPSAPADWWDDPSSVCGGRDLVAGGSWLAVHRSGRLAVVTNHPGRAAAPGAPSRGGLVTGFLLAREGAGTFLDRLAAQADRYAGFCLAVVGPDDAGLLTATGSPAVAQPLAPGITVLSNGDPQAHWPKTAWLREAMTLKIDTDDLTVESLMTLLSRREPVRAVAGSDLPALQRATPFIVGGSYGTRASTVVRFDRQGRGELVERRFAPDGTPAGESVHRFAIEPCG